MKCRFLRLIVVAILPFAACAERELGVCAHLTYDEFDALEQTLAAAKAAGMRSVRTDFNFIQIKLPAEEGAAFDFARFEKVVSAAARFDIEILPVIHELPEGVKGGVRENEALWRRLVREVVRHFRGRIPAWEVWNEENIRTPSKPYEPTDYFFILRTAAEEIRAADPAAKVVLGGLSHTDTAYVEELYALGAKPYVDILNFTATASRIRRKRGFTPRLWRSAGRFSRNTARPASASGTRRWAGRRTSLRFPITG